MFSLFPCYPIVPCICCKFRRIIKSGLCVRVRGAGGLLWRGVPAPLRKVGTWQVHTSEILPEHTDKRIGGEERRERRAKGKMSSHTSPDMSL